MVIFQIGNKSFQLDPPGFPFPIARGCLHQSDNELLSLAYRK